MNALKVNRESLELFDFHFRAALESHRALPEEDYHLSHFHEFLSNLLICKSISSRSKNRRKKKTYHDNTVPHIYPISYAIRRL